MKEQDLPAISVDHSVVPPASVNHTKVSSAGEPGGKPQSEAAGKFQLGETLPVVPSRIVARIHRGDFVDMAELGEEHLELELRRATEGKEGKHMSKGRLRPAHVGAVLLPVCQGGGDGPPETCGPIWL